MALPRCVLMRSLAPSAYEGCLRSDAAASIDGALAERQHADYAAALSSRGVAVEWVREASSSADDVFIEDTAVVLDHARVLITNPGAPTRQPETPAVASALERLGYAVVRMPAGGGATLDGGDVLRAGPSLLFVGLSSRTNAAGAAFLAREAAEVGISQVVQVPVPEGLHLKSFVTLAEPGVLLFDAAALRDEASLAPLRASGLQMLPAPASEPLGANVLALRAGGEAGAACVTVVSRACPATAAMLRGRGHEVVEVEVGELHKGDGALTCLSLRLPREGSWST